MTSGPPRPRYRVVEEGRRLVVIDTQTGQPAARQGDTRGVSEPAPLGPERIAFDGRSVLVTRPFYDDKGPRELTLDEGATRLVETVRVVAIGTGVAIVIAAVLMPALWVAAIPAIGLVANGRARAGARARLTRWLDRYDASAG